MENGPEKAARMKGTEIFVGGLAQSTKEETLQETFSEFGKIIDIRMMKDQNGNLKGYGFIRFTTKEAAARAQKEKHGAFLNGKKIRVSPSTDQDRIFIGSLKKEWTHKEVDDMIRKAFQDVVDVELAVVPDVEGTSVGTKRLNRGFGFITFKDHSAAARAYRIGNKPDFNLEDNWHPIIDWAQTETDFDPDELAKVTVAFVSNLPNNISEDFLRKLFEPFGKLERIAISRKAEFPVGFVHFANRAELDSAIEELDGKTVKGPDKKQSFVLQVAVSKPVDKSKKRSREESRIETGTQKKLVTGSIYPGGAIVHPRVIVDPGELAVLGLRPNVTEKLLQIFRRGLISQHEIDVRVLEDLRDLPEASAVEILDKFASANLAEMRSKGGYLASLVRKTKKGSVSNKTGAKRSLSETGSQFLQNGPYNLGIVPSTNMFSDIYSLPSRVSSGSDLLGHGGYGSSFSTLAMTGDIPDSGALTNAPAMLDVFSYPSYQSRAATFGFTGTGGYTGLGNLSTYSSLGGLGRLDSHGKFGGDEVNAPSHRPFKFDPYTGEPFKFDPYTGEPLQHSSTSSTRLGGRNL